MEETNDRKYFDYAESYADSVVNEDGTIKTYRLEEYNIDRLNSGKFSRFTKKQRTKVSVGYGFIEKPDEYSSKNIEWFILA